ncbi:MAG: hypothetical protein NTX61_17350 [Bacteroidetes bacterium]|nr:hypothetical protein [Bacteroidota bacterium]
MKSIYLSFLKKIIIFTIILGIIAATLSFILPKPFLTPFLPLLFLFFPVITFSTFSILVKSADKKFIRFLNYFLLTIILKLFLFIGILIAYLILNKPDAIPFTLTFFILYLCYTVFEVIQIISYSNVKWQNGKL